MERWGTTEGWEPRWEVGTRGWVPKRVWGEGVRGEDRGEGAVAKFGQTKFGQGKFGQTKSDQDNFG